MARKILTRIKLQITLTVQRSLHVGGANEETAVDLALAINGQGNVYIPGTSLAGTLRAWSEKVDPTLTKQLWGYQANNGPAGDGHASFILVEDAEVNLNGKTMRPYQMEVRQGIGVDRALGTTVENFLFTRAVIPRGATFTIELTIELASHLDTERQKIQQHLDQMLKALEEGDIRFGAAKTRGLGLVKLTACRRHEQTLNSFTGILAALQPSPGELYTQYRQAQPSQTLVKLQIHWRPIGSLMVKSEQAGVAIDILPLMGQHHADEQSFVLPGSSIKGALRTQAERILRTILNLPDPDPHQAQSRQAFTQSLDVPLVNELFGCGARSPAPEVQTQASGLAALSIDDCYSRSTFSAARVRSWQSVPELDKNIQQAFHVAIDRWTGGAADQLLYSTLEPFAVQWEPIQLTLDCARLADQEGAAIALLYLVLRDLSKNRIPLGYGVNRGFGGLEIESITVTEPSATPRFKILEQVNSEVLDVDRLTALNALWKQWIQAHQASCHELVEAVAE